MKTLDITLTTGEPEYLQIMQHVRWAVANGQLVAGDRLEPVRALAARLGVNASTAARAYRLLEMDGVVETRQRRGTIVAAASAHNDPLDLRRTRLRQIVERTLVETLALGFSLDEVEASFGLQAAAWRQRRAQSLAADSPVADANRSHRFAGSHDLALEALWMLARRAHPHEAIAPRYVGSLDGLLQLLRGDAALAGTHMLDEETGEYNLPILRRLFVGRPLAVVILADREQGLMAAAGNPKRIATLHDLQQPTIRFINRQAGSGTRTLLDYHLRQMRIAPSAIAGYDHAVYTHTAVADAIARGHADAGLGLRAAAHAFGLDFVPLARERYHLVTLAEWRTQPPLSWLFDAIASPAFKAIVSALVGYDASHTGETTTIG